MTGRGRTGRRRAMRMLGLAVALDLLVLALFVAEPNTIGPLGAAPPRFIGVVPAVGIALNLIGLAWMGRVAWVIRDPERHGSSWRSSR